MADDENGGVKHPTQPGYHSPRVEEDGAPSRSIPVETSGELEMDHYPPNPPPTQESPSVRREDVSKNYIKTPLVEIEVVHEHGPAPRTERPWKTLEVWTRNRIYTMDPTMICVEVSDRVTNKTSSEHAFVGSRLVGGQHRQGERIELSCPFPRPGTEAVFEHPEGRRGNFSRTSTVTRVVLRLHVVTVSPSYVVPTWETITGSVRFTPPTEPPGKKQ